MTEENNYYSIQAISNSALSAINPEQGGSPMKFEKKILNGEIEEAPNPSFENGKIVHKYVEDPSIFNVSDFSKPSDMMSAWVERTFAALPPSVTETNFLDSEVVIKSVALDVREDAYSKMKDETVLNKFWNEGLDYISYLFLEKGDTIIITPSQKEMLDEIIVSINNNPMAFKLLFEQPGFGETIEAYNEKAIYWKKEVSPGETYDNVSINMKSLVDRFRLHFLSDKSILVDLVDFKTTSSAISNFKYSFEKYRYFRQLAVYKEAITEFIKQEFISTGKYPEDVNIVFNYFIVAVETRDLYQCRVFKISDKYVWEGEDEYYDLLREVAYHQASGQWIRTREEFKTGFELLIPEECQ